MTVQYVLTNKTNDALAMSQEKIPFCDEIEMVAVPSHNERILIGGNAFQIVLITWMLVANVYTPSILIQLDKRG